MNPPTPTKILLIEDEEHDREIFYRYFRREGEDKYSITHAKSLKEAYGLLNKEKIDIIFSDLSLHDSHEINSIIELIKKFSTTPVIILSGNSDEKIATDLVQTGAQDYLVKGHINPTLLKRCINSAIERKKIELKLIESEKSKDEILSIVSHDLRNPLSSIEMISNNLLNERNNQDYIRISRNARYCLNLISDLLDITSLEGKIKLEIDEFEISSLIKSCIDNNYTKITSKEIHINTKNVKHFKINADYGRLSQVINNVIGNAIKFLQPRGTINFETEKKDNEFTLIIEDNGPGIPQNKLKTVFEKYEQVHTKHKKGGTGLGLNICKKICELHNGKIWATSKNNSGTSIHIRLPQIKMNKLLKNSNKNILIVDDSSSVRELTTRMLKNLHYNHMEATNGQDALNIMKEEIPDAILLDWNMPLLNGKQTLETIRQDPRLEHIPVIIYSSKVEKDDLDFLFKYADSFIHKPCSEKELDEKINSILKINSSYVVRNINKNKDKNVLIVDDMPEARESLKSILNNNFDYNIIEAKNGLEALFVTDKYKIDLVLSDIQMFGMNGHELAQELYHKGNKVPLILYSGMIDKNFYSFKNKYGILDFFHKPFNKKKIIKMVKGTFNSHSSYQSLIDLKVLIVDDCEDNLYLNKKLLEDLGSDVKTAKNPQECLDIYKKEKFDLILMDINIPEKNGYQIAKEIRELEYLNKSSQTPIVSLTAKSSVKNTSHELTVFDFSISKPITSKDLYQLNNFLNRRFISSFTEKAYEDFHQVKKDHKDYIKTYIAHRETDLENSLKYMQKSNFKEVRSICHRVLGSAKGFGLLGLDEIVTNIQGNARSEDIEGIKKNLACLKNYIHKFKEKVER